MIYDEKTLKNMDKNELIEVIYSANEELEKSHKIIANQQNQIKNIQYTLNWFINQLFGRKSEKIVHEETGYEPEEFEFMKDYKPSPTPPDETVSVKTYERKHRKKITNCKSDGRLTFTKDVPVEEQVILPKEVENLSPDQYVVIGEDVQEFLAERPGSYYVKKVIRKKVKIKETKKIIRAALPSEVSIIDKSLADVSFLAGLVINKFRYHLPLHRQYQMITNSGIKLSRSTLINLVNRTAELLTPIYMAIQSRILSNKIVMMDETPVKAGREDHKMKNGYFWVIHGDHNTAFFYSRTRKGENIKEILKNFEGIIVSDGYKPYETFAVNNRKVQRAQCWAHVRRKFFNALETEPDLAKPVIDYIRDLYLIEKACKEENNLEIKAEIRRTKSKLIVDKIFSYLTETVLTKTLVPSSLFQKAAQYAFSNETALKCFIVNPEVPLDNNEVERANRYNAVGRKNYMFHWTEVGAENSAILYSIITTCIDNGVNPYKYLTDVLQRISDHPACKIELLTPQLWKDNFNND